MNMKNRDLKKFYNRVYTRGEKKHYSKLLFGEAVTEEKKAVLDEISWKSKEVLDIGCGTGELAYRIALKGAKRVIGIDYSYMAIHIGKSQYRKENLHFECADLSTVSGSFDVIIIVGVLEHIDNPFNLLRKAKKLLKKGGSLIITCPNWSNARGYILLALKELFDAQITLVDFHYFTSVEFEEWAKKLRMKLTWKTIEQSWGHGKKMIQDFKKRLPNVLRDVPAFKNPKAITNFISWLDKHAVPLEENTQGSGAVGFYHFKK